MQRLMLLLGLLSVVAIGAPLGVHGSLPASAQGATVSGAELLYVAADGLRSREAASGADRRITSMSSLGPLGPCSSTGSDPMEQQISIRPSPDGLAALVYGPRGVANCSIRTAAIVDLGTGATTVWPWEIRGSLPKWAPNGSSLLWATGAQGDRTAAICDRQATCRVIAQDTDAAVWAGDGRVVTWDRVASESIQGPGSASDQRPRSAPDVPMRLVEVSRGSSRPLNIAGFEGTVDPTGRFLAYTHDVRFAVIDEAGSVAVLDLNTPGAAPIELGEFYGDNWPRWAAWRSPLVFGHWMLDPGTARVSPLPDLVQYVVGFASQSPLVVGVNSDIFGAGIGRGENEYHELNLVDLRSAPARTVFLSSYSGFVPRQARPGYDAAISSDGSLVAYVGQPDLSGRIVRSDGRPVRELPANTQGIIGFSPDGSWVATLSGQGVTNVTPVSGGDGVPIGPIMICMARMRCANFGVAWRPLPNP